MSKEIRTAHREVRRIHLRVHDSPTPEIERLLELQRRPVPVKI